MTRSVFLSLLAILATFQAQAVTPPGLVFEAEDIALPKEAWLKDAWKPGLWTLWTREQDIEKKRSGGAVLASPPVESDRAAPEEGAPPLHCVVRLEPGCYEAHLSPPGRPLAFSADGKAWRRYQGGELHLGVVDCRSGRFDFWIDDRYAHPPANRGAGYFDSIRFTPASLSALAVRSVEPWVGLEETVSHSGTGSVAVAARDCERQGFEPDGPFGVKSEGKGAWLAWKATRAGTFYWGVQMIDDADGIEDLRVRCGGKEVGQCVGSRDDDRRVLFVSKEPLRVNDGDRIEFVAQGSVGFYRIEKLFFSSQPIEPPPLQLEHLVAWSPRPGTAHLCWTSTRPVADGRLCYGVEGAPGSSVEGSPVAGRNHRVILTGLEPNQTYRAWVETVDPSGKPCSSASVHFRATPPAPSPAENWSIELNVNEPAHAPRPAWPVTGGVPFARGKLARVEDLRVSGPDGKPVVSQAEPFVLWPDGSVKVALLSFVAATQPGITSRYRLEARPGTAVTEPAGVPAFSLAEDESGWKIRGNGLQFDLPRSGPAFPRMVLDDPTSPASGNLHLRTAEGADLVCGAPEVVTCERIGPVQGILRWSGRLIDATAKPTDWAYLMRATLVAGRPEMDLDVAIWPEAREPLWWEVDSLSLHLPLGLPGKVRGSLEGRPLEEIPPNGLSVLQETEQRARWEGCPEPPSGKAFGVAMASNERQAITAVLPEFRETYPNALRIRPDGLHIGLLPDLGSNLYADEKPLEQLRLFGWYRDGRYVIKRGQALRKRVFLRFAPLDEGTDATALAAWANAPLQLQPTAEHLCASGLFGRPLYPRTAGVWEAYERYFEKGFADLEADRIKSRTWGWMHHGDWFGERLLNYGNNEYDLAWTMALQWARTADRRLFDRGWEMARHHSTADTLRGEFTAGVNGLVYEHSFNHVGIELLPDDPRRQDPLLSRYLEEYGAMLGGAIDRQGHVYQAGNWIYAALTGDPWLRETAERVSTNQAEKLTPAFDFGIERAGGWPLINMVMAYHFGGDPYYLNAARLMVERTLQRQDPVSGGWLHWHAGSESGGETGLGGKAFAVGILTHGLLRYLEQEPEPRPDVEKMLIRGADSLRDHCWVPGQGFRYISHLAYHRDRGRRSSIELLNAELVAFAYEKTRDPKYLDFFREIMKGRLDGSPGGNGKGFSMALRQTVYGLDRARGFGISDAP